MITDEQLDNFIKTETPFDPSEPPVVRIQPLAVSGLSFMLPIAARDKLRKAPWTSDKIKTAQQSLNSSLGVNDVIPPTVVEQQNRLDFWWRQEGQFIPRHVLDQLGIVGGEKVPTLDESIKLGNAQQVSAVKDFLAIERFKGDDPLNMMVSLPQPADPSAPPDPLKEVKPEMVDIIKAATIEDLQVIKGAINENPLEFGEGLLRAVSDEIKIKKTMPTVIDMLGDKPLLILLGTDFFNTLAFNLPEFTSRKGLSPVENLLDLPKGSESIWIRSVARVREQLVAEDPRLLTKIGLEAGGISADLVKFVLLPDPSKASVFAKLSPAVKAAIGVGTKAGLIALLQAPEVGETFEARVKSVAVATGIGALTGAVLSKMVTTIRDIPLNRQAAKLAEKFPEFSKKDFAVILRTIRENRLVSLKFAKPVEPARRIAPAGFRLGMAEIEKPAKAVVKVAPKVKEAAAVEAAKVALRLKGLAAAVKPTKILTKVEALSLQKSNLITGEGEKIRIVADAKTQKLLQTKENEIAKLKTRRNELLAQKKFAVAKTQAVEIAKKEKALANLKEKSGVKLEQTIEGSKAKIAKIREAKEFKDSLRNDAISMIVAIPKELRAGFINRANKVKTLKGLHKLAGEIEAGVERFERRGAIADIGKTIKDVEKKNRLGIERMGKIPSPQRERIIKMVDSVDLKKLSEVKEADLVSLQKHVQKLANELAGNIEALDEDVEMALKLPNKRQQELLRLSQKKASELDIDDIRLLNESIQSVVHNAKVKSKLMIKGGLKPLDQAVKKAVAEITPTGKARRKVARIEKGEVEIGIKPSAAKQFVILNDAHLDTLVETSASSVAETNIKLLDTDTHRGLRETAEHLIKWVDATADRFEKIGFKSLEQLEPKFTVTLGGKRILVTTDDMVSLELMARSPENLRAFLKTEGLLFTDSGIEVDFSIGDNRLEELNTILQGAVRNNDMLMGIADWNKELNIMTGGQREVVNEITMTMSGHPIARDDSYYPRPRALPARVEGGRADISVPPEQIGRYQPRTGGTLRMKIRPWSEVFLEGLESDAHIGGMAIPLRNARILVSNPVFQKAMRDAGRDGELKNIITILRRTQGITTSRSLIEVLGSKVLRGFTSAALGFRLSTIGTQAMSYPAYASEIGIRWMLPPKPITPSDIAYIEEISSLMKLRWKGRRIGVEVGASASVEAFEVLFFGKSRTLANRGFAGLVVGDKQAIGNGFRSVVNKILNMPRNGKNVDPFEWDGRNVADLPEIKGTFESNKDNKVFRWVTARYLEFATRRTQPMFDMLDRSVRLSNPSPLARSPFMFRTALEGQLNIIQRAINDLIKGVINKAQFAEKIGSVVASSFSVAAWKLGIKWAISAGITSLLAAFGIFKFKEKKEAKTIVGDIAKKTTEIIVGLPGIGRPIFFVGERVADILLGDGYNWNRESFENPILETLEAGPEALVAITEVVADVTRIDEFIEDAKTQRERDFNEKFIADFERDLTKAISASFDFGVRIIGVPFLAPQQEFLKPLLSKSKIKLINEITFDDVDKPQTYSQRIFDLYEKRKELNAKSKKELLSRNEQASLNTLNSFANKADKTADVIRETEDSKQRQQRFSLFEVVISSAESRLEFYEAL